jgi:hypothetical protein
VLAIRRPWPALGCERIELIRRGANPDFVAALGESYVTLADEQAYRGYCILLLRDHHEHVADLPCATSPRVNVRAGAECQGGALAARRRAVGLSSPFATAGSARMPDHASASGHTSMPATPGEECSYASSIACHPAGST